MKKHLWDPQRPRTAYLLAMACSILWGSGFPSTKLGYRLFDIASSDTASLLLFAGVRLFFGGLLVLLLETLLRKKMPIPKKGSFPCILAVALTQTVLQYCFLNVGLANTTGVKGSILASSNVFFLILISSTLFKMEKLSLKKLLGCLVGFSGVLIINLHGLDLHFNFLGDAFVLFSSISYALSCILIKKFSSREEPVTITCYQFLLGGGTLIAIGLIFGGRLKADSPAAVSILMYLVFTAAVAYAVWNLLLKYHPISRIAPFEFVNPVVGVLLSTLILKEDTSFGWSGVAALLLVCAGIVIVNFEPSPQKTNNTKADG